MKRKVLILILLFIFMITIGVISYNKTDQLSMREKVEDFEYMYNVIKDGYPYLDVNKRRNDIDWLGNKEKYLKRIKNTKNNEEFIEELSSILADLDNRHTELIDNKKRYELFKKSYSNNNWYDFLDDKKVVDRYNSIGSKIEIPKNIFSKKEFTLGDVVKKEVGYIYLPSMASRNGSIDKDLKMIEDYIKNLGNYKALIIDIRENKGGSDTYWKGIVSKLTKNDIQRNGYILFRNDSKVVGNYISKRNIKLEPIKNLPMEVKKKAPKETFEKFSDFEKTSYKIKADDNEKFEGNIYLLVDEKVYSSAESFAMFCKSSKFATIIGQTTGGDGGGIDPVLFKLKNSGLIARMASGMYLNKDGICDEEFKTTPDYKVKNCKMTKNLKNDSCIKKVLELENIL
jgi:hypothetical protein